MYSSCKKQAEILSAELESMCNKKATETFIYFMLQVVIVDRLHQKQK